MNPKLLLPVFTLIQGFSFSFAQPADSDYVLGYGGTALFMGMEFVFKDELAPRQANWIEPGSFDTFFREELKWRESNMMSAALLSDIMLKGIIIPSVLLSSLGSGYKYSSYLLLQMQVIAATGIMTHSTKFISGRQRPYLYFKTQESGYTEDNLSFFSGHSSISFAVVTSTAFLLQKKFPHSSGLIWSSGLAAAAATGYLRIAADRHYMTDVLTGIITGTALGYLITRTQHKRFFNTTKKTGADFMINFSIPVK